MSALPKSPLLTAEEYLARELKAEFKSEFYQGEMFAMAGASKFHNLINDNISIEIGGRLKGGPCRTVSNDQRLRVDATGLYTYPDYMIVCGPRLYDPRNKDTLLNPTVIFEILSPSTESYDTGTKFRHYQKIESVREIVLVSQETMMVQVYERQPDGKWLLSTFDESGGEMKLTTVPVSVPLADIYRDVEFPPPVLRSIPPA